MDISVILSTYNEPKWLEKVIWGFACQTFKDFEIVIADDGSKQETKATIERLISEFPALAIKHVWHPDDGFRKSEILNKAILASEGGYLVFTDGDCIPRKDFLQQHVNRRKKGYFLSGGYCKLSMETSQKLSQELIESEQAFDPLFLHQHGLKKSPFAKHVARGFYAELMNFLTPTSPTWNGHNASTWREHFFEVNGFDQRMVYGGQDREFGERLVNLGLKSIQIRYSAVCLHLDHPRGYKTQEGIDFNKKIRSHTRESKTTWAENGIETL